MCCTVVITTFADSLFQMNEVQTDLKLGTVNSDRSLSYKVLNAKLGVQIPIAYALMISH